MFNAKCKWSPAQRAHWCAAAATTVRVAATPKASRTDQIMIMIKYHPFQSDIKQAEGKLFSATFHRYTRRRRWIPLTLVDGAYRFFLFFSLKIIFLASNLSLVPFTAAFLFFFFSFFHFTQYPHRHIYCCCCAAVTVPAAGECQHSYILCACVNTFEAWFGVCVGDIRHLWQCDIIHRKRTEHEMFCTHKNAYIPLTNAHTHTHPGTGHCAACWLLECACR